MFYQSDKLQETADFLGEMIKRMEEDFPFLKNAEKKTDSNVIHVDFNKKEEE